MIYLKLMVSLGVYRDLAYHIYGFIAVVAHIHVLQEGTVMGHATDVIPAANTVAEVALRLVRPGKKDAYVVGDERRRYVLREAGKLHRRFRTDMRRKCLRDSDDNYKEHPQRDLYPKITQEHWDNFVAWYKSDAFQEPLCKMQNFAGFL